MYQTTLKFHFPRYLLLWVFVGFHAVVFAQGSINITGIVTDDRNEPLPGVTVMVKGTNTGVVSTIDGKYTIKAPGKNSVLVFSFTGFVTQEITVGNQHVIDVGLNESIVEMDEVVVIGYGSQKKATLTGAVVAIDNKEIITTKSNNVQNSLTGKMAGVKVVQRSSEPGTFDVDFSIRGMGTPLIVIDDVPRDNMTRLDPNEIESISILKDASAAVYGTRAANGVVLITTKRGKQDTKFQFDYTGYIGSESFIKDLHPLDATGFMSLVNEKNFNRGQTNLLYGRSIFQQYEDGFLKSSDWVGTSINPHPLETQHSISASGGTKAVSYFANFGYSNQEGRWKTDATNYQRFNLRSNVSAQLTKSLTGVVMLNLMQEQRRSQIGDTWRIFNSALTQYPTSPIYLPDPVTGEESTEYPFLALNTHTPMMLDTSKSGYDLDYRRQVQTNLSLEWEIPGVKGLKAKGMYSFDFRDDDSKSFRKMYNLYDSFYKPVSSGDRYIRRSDVKYVNTLIHLSMSYNKTLWGKHNLNLLAVYEESSREADNYWVRRNTVLSSIDQLYAGSQVGIQGTQDPGLVYHYTNKGLVGKVGYDYKSKYIVDFSFRYDGSSKFGPGHQWGFFPVGSAAWRLSEESFIKDNVSILNNLKLRASYGILGDDGAAAYQFITGYEYPVSMSGGNYVMNGEPIASARSVGTPNKEFTWFTSASLNIGLEFELWKGLLGGEVDIFQRDRSGLVSTRLTTLPEEAGVTLPDENLNSDQTRGIEITLTHRHKINQFRYNFSGYVAMDRTKEKYIEQRAFTGLYDNWRYNMTDRWSLPQVTYDGRKAHGYDANNAIFWGTEYLGNFRSIEEVYANDVIYDGAGNVHLLPGDLIYNDWNKDGVIDGNDDHPIGSRHTTLSYGITIGMEYKGIDLNFVWQGTAGNRRRLSDNNIYFEQPVMQDQSGLMEFSDRWRRADEFNPSNDQEWIPGYYPSVYTQNERDFITRNSTFWIQNASFLRLKTVELGYTIPSRLTQKISVRKVRFFFNGYNLLTFSKMRLVDPEQNGIYPLNKSFNAGLSASF